MTDFTPGKYYRLPSGEKGMYVGRTALDGFAFAYYIRNNPFITTYDWNINGQADQITEWKEPRTFEYEVYLIESKNQPFVVVGDDGPALGKPLARKKITITEGEGME